MKKITFVILSFIAVLIFPSTALAKDSSFVIGVEQVSVHNIVPESIVDQYKGRFNSYEEVAEHFGLVKNNSASNESSSKTAIEINSVDELAAYIAYSKQLLPKENELHSSNISPNSLPEVREYSWTVYDSWVWWVTGFADVQVNWSNNTITSVAGDQSIHGFHVGIGLSNHTSNPFISNDKKSFTMTFRGTITYNLYIEGMLEFWSEPYSWSVTQTVFANA